MNKEKIKLYLCKDSELFYMSICYLVMENPHIKVERFSCEANALVDDGSDSAEGVLVVKYSWFQKNEIAGQERFLSSSPRIPLLLYLEPDEYHLITALFRLGVQGFFTEHITKEEFGCCLHELVEGRTFFSQDLIPLILSEQKSLQMSAKQPAISPRESEILKLIISGYTNKEIAAKLYLSARTVEGHRARLLQKFDVRNTAELVFEATRRLDVA
jgi:two-component system response regulator NreC